MYLLDESADVEGPGRVVKLFIRRIRNTSVVLRAAPQAYEEEPVRLHQRELDLKKLTREAKSGLVKLSGMPEEQAKWDTYEYKDLGAKNPCFVPGTLVHTPVGTRKIEELDEGEQVLVWDFEKEAVTCRPVAQVSRSWTAHLLKICIEGEAIVSTRLHRFWNGREREWTQARRLWMGDLLMAPNGQPVVFSTELFACSSPTFNLEVEGIHNYLVGETGIIVHNGGESGFPTAERRQSAI